MKIVILSISFLTVSLIATAQKLIKPDTTFTVRYDKDTILQILIDKGSRVRLDIKKVKPATRTAWKNFKDRITLRQSFQNIKDKDEAAFINLVYPRDSSSSKNFSFAVGYNVWAYEKEPQLFPFFEWQKNTLASKKQDAILAGLTFQAPLRGADRPIRQYVTYAVSTINYKKDDIKKTKGIQASLYLTPVFANMTANKFYPLPDVEIQSALIKFVYNIYGGLEYEDRIKTTDPTQQGSVWRWVARANGKFYPFSALVKNRLEIVPEITYRNVFTGNSTIEDRENIIRKISFNIIILDKTKDAAAGIDVKLGFDHTNGIDPTKGFDGQRINTLTLKVKF